MSSQLSHRVNIEGGSTLFTGAASITDISYCIQCTVNQPVGHPRCVFVLCGRQQLPLLLLLLQPLLPVTTALKPLPEKHASATIFQFEISHWAPYLFMLHNISLPLPYTGCGGVRFHPNERKNRRVFRRWCNWGTLCGKAGDRSSFHGRVVHQQALYYRLSPPYRLPIE